MGSSRTLEQEMGGGVCRGVSCLGPLDPISLSLPSSARQVDEEEMRKQQEEIQAILKMRIAGTSSGTQVS